MLEVAANQWWHVLDVTNLEISNLESAQLNESMVGKSIANYEDGQQEANKSDLDRENGMEKSKNFTYDTSVQWPVWKKQKEEILLYSLANLDPFLLLLNNVTRGTNIQFPKKKHGKSQLCSYECFLFLSQLNLFTKLDSILQVSSSKLHFLTNLLFAKNILPALIKKPQNQTTKIQWIGKNPVGFGSVLVKQQVNIFCMLQ